MKTLLLALTYLVGIGELILAIYFWATNSKSEIRRVMAILAFATAGWGITNAMTNSEYSLVGVLPFVFGALLLTAMVHFAIVFPYRKFTFDRLHVLGLYLPWAFFSYLLLWTRVVVADMYLVNNAGYTTGGSIFPAFNFYLALLYFLGLGLIIWKLTKLEGVAKKNTMIIFFSLLIAGLPGVFFAIFHFMENVPYNYLYGPISSIVWLGATTYIVRKK